MQCSEHRVCVLVADDYPDTAESMATCLSAAGLETRVTRDGAEAVEIAKVWQPRVCVVAADPRDLVHMIEENRSKSGARDSRATPLTWIPRK